MNDDTSRGRKSAIAAASIHDAFHALLDSTDEAMLLLREGLILGANPSARTMFGLKGAAIEMRYPEDLSPPLQPDGASSREKGREMLALAKHNGNCRYDWLHAACPSSFWAEVMLTRIASEEDGSALTYALVRDITARKEAEQAVALAAKVFELGRDAVLIADCERRIVTANHAYCTITGHAEDHAPGRLMEEVLGGLQDDELRRRIFKIVDSSGYWEGEAWDRRADGQIYPLWLKLIAVFTQSGDITHRIAVFSDISERKLQEERNRHLAEHDSLTGLPNRILLLDRLGQTIASSRRNGSGFALMFIDLDRFKIVNDSMGHQIGDKLLQEVAGRLKRCVRAIDTVSRQGGDEFIVLLADISQPKQVARIARSIMDEICRPCQIDGHELSVSACIGISTYPNDGEDIDTLIRNADLAMYYVKGNGRNGYQFFNEDINARIRERTALEYTLKKALEQEEFLLHFQPEVEFSSGRIVGAEALIRWNHPQHGRLLPTRFITVAEECGLIIPIGQWVLRRACIEARRWRDQGYPLVVSVNLSASQFRHGSLAQSVADALEMSGLEPQYLSLELTEGMLNGADSVAESIHALKSLGVKLCIDDFGTGLFCLSLLDRFRVDRLKIDRSFVQGIMPGVQDNGLLRAMVDMARNLEMEVIAEGVETAQQFGYLQVIGCDRYQGNYASPPLAEMSPAFLPASFPAGKQAAPLA